MYVSSAVVAIACEAGAWKQWVKERTGAPVSPSRAPVFSCTPYFQAPATHAFVAKTAESACYV